MDEDGQREREQQIRKWVEKERGCAYIKWQLRETKKKKIEKNENFFEISCKIDKLM